MPKQPTTYIVTNRPNGTLYVGVTSALVKRIWQHRTGVFEGFAKRHGLTRLVYLEVHPTMTDAIRREKQLKKLTRARKIELIQRENPDWRDLWALIAGDESVDPPRDSRGCAEWAIQEDRHSRLRGTDVPSGFPPPRD